ncbi:hypothetical protein I4I73_02540 [Pseudonocardia sp. KRD-184]|uniref:Uncharacterized protein n=1 Tax=Pseudonocardia oceani TaxID=2792013 RepID=A0ABS6U2Y0_9PSEU|nr:hypothetical protein [Pseudonocardia oceani]MBW0089603.1 hypothetical protein [Pseudonocardia oceani]MBW0094877.1 hypothetical protein [Pseudonocardia oceani]MBW0111856.1 hypothetical protein [Pseudonocardia oceani]MBW0120576.1 hypothetical protein [Pseudonocardia oceani]MBW0126269.1 hypothetical protein [Pseudonocardia oceani]
MTEFVRGLTPPPGGVQRTVERLTSTWAVLGWPAALGAALLLERPGWAMVHFVVVVAALSLRVSVETHLPESAVHHPPFRLQPHDGLR